MGYDIENMKFRDYLVGQNCVVYTDNNPLSHLSTAKLGATEHHWAAQLASFDFSIKYRSGQSNKNADALSRQHPPSIQAIGVCSSRNISPGIATTGCCGESSDPGYCFSFPLLLPPLTCMAYRKLIQ